MQEFLKLQANMSSFNKRFYLSRLLSGSLISVAVVLGLFLVFVGLEFLLHLGRVPRAVLFYGFTLVSLGIFSIQVVLPALRWAGVLEARTAKETAKAIQRNLPDVEDQLVNALNLNERAERERSMLLVAGLERKAIKLNQIRFAEHIDLRASLLWARFTLIPVLVLFAVSLWSPEVIKEGASRIIQYNTHFTPPAPFEFVLAADHFEVPEGSAFTLEVETAGEALPDNCFVVFDGKEMRMKRQSAQRFSYTFQKLRDDVSLQLRGASVYSAPVTIEVIPQPKLIKTEAVLTFPSYTKRTQEKLLNRAELKIPEGTTVQWLLSYRNASEVQVLDGEGRIATDSDDAQTRFKKRFLDQESIRMRLMSDRGLVDSAQIQVNVVMDAYPKIMVEQVYDSLSGLYYFKGEMVDDYGFSALSFRVENNGQVLKEEFLAVTKGLTEQRFNYAWKPDSLMVDEGAQLAYYFEVLDNDGVNGAKASRTQAFMYRVPSKAEMLEQAEQEAEKTKSSLDEEQEDLKKLSKELDAIKKDLLEKQKPDWEEQERLKEVLKQQQKMMEKLEQRAKEQKRFQEKSEQMNPYSEQLMQKQQMIQEMFEKLFDEEFKEKYKEYQELLEELNKEQMLEKLDEMKMDNEALEKELDRTLELFKELEFEQKLEENLERLEELQEDQEDLNERTEEKSDDADDLKAEQDQLNEEMQDLKEELAKMEELNEALEEPKSTPDLSEEMKDAEESMQEASDELDKGNEKKAGEQQEQASDAMKKMKEKLSQFQSQQAASQQTENLEDMRQLLENIVDLSVEQEKIMEGVKRVEPNDPKYISFAKDQKKIIDDTKVVEDSLLALSKRVPQIDRVINDEITTVKFSMEKGLNYMTNQPPNQERKYVAMAAERQQYAMTALNNLALLFDEIIDQMQKEMAPSMSGSADCNKPGSGKGQKPSASDLKKMQENLNKQLQKMKEAKEKGKNPNGKKPGEQGGGGMGGMSKERARMAAQQAAIRQQLRELSQSLEGERGGRAGDQMKEMEELMEQTEEDILFDKIDAETMRRQQDILTKLLESEKAEREQEMDKEREAQTNYNQFRIPEEVWENFKKEKEKEVEFYQTLPPNLKPFFRNEVNRYFSTIPLGE
jgi:hypothetical protein